jgi:hypothetical protein
MTSDDVVFTDWRWRCPHCARFLASTAIKSEDYRDDGAYYGVSTRISADCPRCGDIEPMFAPTRWTETAP